MLHITTIGVDRGPSLVVNILLAAAMNLGSDGGIDRKRLLICGGTPLKAIKVGRPGSQALKLDQKSLICLKFSGALRGVLVGIQSGWRFFCGCVV